MLTKEQRWKTAGTLHTLADELDHTHQHTTVDWNNVKVLLLSILKTIAPIILAWLLGTPTPPPTPTEAQAPNAT